MSKNKPWQRIRNVFIPALIKRRPKTHFPDKKKQEQRDKCREQITFNEQDE